MCGYKDPVEKYDKIRQVFSFLGVLGNILGLVVIFLLAVYLSNYGGGFGWSKIGECINLHILLMTIFLVFLQADGSLVFRICPTAPKYTAKIIHALLHSISLIGICVGLAAVVHGKDLVNSPHFYTLHSWIGIMTFSFFILQFLVGFTTFLLPIASIEVKVKVLPVHKFIGKSLFICTLGTALTGIMQKGSSLGSAYSTLSEAAMLLNFAALLLAIFGVIMVYLVGNHAFRRRPRAELEPLIATPSTSAGLSTTVTKTYTVYR